MYCSTAVGPNLNGYFQWNGQENVDKKVVPLGIGVRYLYRPEKRDVMLIKLFA